MASFSMKDIRLSKAGVISTEIVNRVVILLRKIALPTSYQSFLVAIGSALMLTVGISLMSFEFMSYAQVG